jgi:hypothetical protein
MAGVAEVLMRAYFSSYHSWAARHFTRLVTDIQNRHTGAPRFDIAHRAYVTGAVFSAAALLEATINELYDDIVDNHPSEVAALSKEIKTLLAILWDESEQYSIERWSILDKYQVALRCSSSPVFDKGQDPYQSAALLVKLRNAIVHARPETRGTADVDSFSQALQKRFPPCRLMANSANPYYPDHCLGAGCASWAVTTAETFTEEFFMRLGIKQRKVDFGAAP